MAKLKVSQIRRGQVVLYENDLWQIVEKTHITPGKGQAVYQMQLKNLKKGNRIPQRMYPDDALEVAHLDMRTMQYLYKDGEMYVLMDNETYEQVNLTEEMFGDATLYVKENETVQVTFWEEKAIGIDLPNTVELEVTDTEPGVKGDTVSNVTKPATLETGLVVQVPLFVERGDTLKVDTRTGDFLQRVSTGG